MLDETTKQRLLDNAASWFRDELAAAHLSKVSDLKSLSQFNVNPFLLPYLANFLEGEATPEALAKALIYPRVLGTSITTSFGSRIQGLITRLFDGVLGSQISGMDIEFTDQLDGRKKYCQLKAGPNIINADDVPVILGNFRSARNLARANHVDVGLDDYVFGLIYGTEAELNQFIRTIGEDHKVLVGKDFWHHLTGEENFYQSLIDRVAAVAQEFDGRTVLEEAIARLAEDISRNL